MIAEVIVDIAHSDVDKIFDYNCPIPEVTVGSRVVVPFGNTKTEGIVINVKDKSDFPAARLKNVLRALDDVPAVTLEGIELMRFMKAKYHIPSAAILRLFLPTEMRKGKVKKKLVTYVSLNEDIPLDEMLSSIRAGADNQALALKKLYDVKTCKIADLKADFSNSSVNRLIEKGYILTSERRENREPYKNVFAKKNDVDFSPAQVNALNSVHQTDKTVTLIHGVTGSGKTVVYLQLIKDVISDGRSAIMLVPEISLTPQMLSQLRAEFGEEVAILHSCLSAGERFDEWWRLRSGEAHIAVGARSAVFAPLENLGLIVIDEEHDGSYVSESSPRYATFDIARFRAEFNGCKLVLGSATPSVETYISATNGEFNLVKMPDRINKKPLPEIMIADMRKEVRRGNNSAFSSALTEELENCVKSGNQAIIFLNRRGYSQHIICRECGYVARCDNCDVALNYHSVGNVLKCHYCGATYKMLTACPDCGSIHINYVGTGTQKVVEELKKLLPSARILRMDNDTTQTKEGHFKILLQFSEHKADILVGTQMIAKGHDFPAVTLVGILDADMSLFFSDYRSGERTFQLITQVAGRSGRADKKGVVVLQTFCPDNPVLRYAVSYDYEGFFARESSLRKTTSFPPFAVIVRVMVESDEETSGMETLKEVYLKLSDLYSHNKTAFLFFNKMRSPIKRLKNKFRYQVLMRISSSRNDIVDKVYELSLPCSNSKALVYVELNPANLS
ncbi:MAG: primosomal protein N' [Clostridia bacterium]|nr:primosomal protein N' [Clostridia bacterium]